MQNLIAVLTALILCFLFERIYSAANGAPDDIAEKTLDLLLISGAFLASFVSGERAFSPDLMERRFVFMCVLPVSRVTIWFSIASARLLALLLSLVVLAARPGIASMLANKSDARNSSGLLTIIVLIVPFASGVTFSLSVGRTFYAYIIGLTFLGVAYFEAGNYSRLIMPDSQGFFFFSFCLALLAEGLALLSLHFFKQGESRSPKRRLKNNLLLLAWISGWWALSWNLASRTDVFISSPHTVSYELNFASTDGRYLCVTTTSGVQPNRSVLNIVDVSTGRVLGRRASDGVFWVRWARDNSALEVLSHNRPWFDPFGSLFPETITWTRLSPAAKVIASIKFPKELAVGSLASGGTILVAKTFSTSEVFYLEGDTGRFTEITQGPTAGSARIAVTRQGEAFVGLGSYPLLAWSIRGQVVQNLPPPRELASFSPSVIFGKIIQSRPETRQELQKMYPPPSEAQGGILLPSGSPLVLRDQRQSGIFFLEMGDDEKHPVLWARNGLPGPWRRLSEVPTKVAVTVPGDLDPILERYWDLGERTSIDFDHGIVAYWAVGNAEVSLYDPALEDIVKGPSCPGTEPSSIRAYSLTNSDDVFVRIACRLQDRGIGKILGFHYRPGSGEVKQIIEWIEPVSTFELPLHFGENGASIWIRHFDELRQEIWRISPIGEGLRLWPPARAGSSSNPALANPSP